MDTIGKLPHYYIPILDASLRRSVVQWNTDSISPREKNKQKLQSSKPSPRLLPEITMLKDQYHNFHWSFLKSTLTHLDLDDILHP